MGKNWKESLPRWLQGEALRKAVVPLGICGMALIGLASFWEPGEPAPSSQQPPSSEDYAAQLEEDLCRMVSAITGEAAPTVVVTLEDEGQSQYAADLRENSQQEEGRSTLEREEAYVLVEDREGSERALTQRHSLPQVRGVVVVSRAAGDPAVREELLLALCTALDVSSAKVYVTGAA